MSFRKTAILGAVLVVLAAYFYIFEAGKNTGPEAETVFKIDKDNITRIEITANGETTVTENIPRLGWQIVDPLKYPADPATLGMIINEFSTLSPARTVVDSASDLSEYGLDPPSAVVEISAGLAAPHTLYLGDPSTVASSYYAVAKGSRRVFLVEKETNTKFRKTTVELRDRKILHVDRDKVTYVSVRSNTHQPLICEIDSLDTWRVFSPFELPAERNEAINLVSNISSIKAVEFVEDHPKSLIPYGLQQPAAVATLKSRDGKIDATVSFATTGDGRIYAMSNERNTVYTVGAYAFDQILRDPQVYRRATACDFKSYNVSKVNFQIGPESVSCVKRSFEDWRMMEPVQTRADDRLLTALLDSLEVMQIKEYIPATPSNLKAYGLDKARITITCELDNKLHPQQIQIGRLSDDGRSVYVRDARENWIYAVASTRLQGLPSTALDLRDRRILRFKGYEVHMIEVVRGDYRLRVRRDQKQRIVWKIEEPFRQDADAVAVGKAFGALDSVYAEIFVSDDEGTDLSRFGLDKPSMVITLQVGGRNDVSEERLSLLVGKPFPGDASLVYVKRRDSPEISLARNTFVTVINRLIENTSSAS